MAFDPEKEGFVEVFDAEAEGFVEVTDAPPPPTTTEEATERAGKVYDTAVEEEVPLQVADKYFYSTANNPLSIRHADFTEPVPDNRIGFSEEFKRQWELGNAITKVPITGGVIGAIESASIVNVANRLADPSFEYDRLNRYNDEVNRKRPSGLLGIERSRKPSAASRESDQKFIATLIKDFERRQRGLTFGGKVAAGISQLPTWMVEFAATGGLASLGDDAARKVGEKLIRKHIETLAGKAAIKTAGLVTGAVVRTSTGLLPRVGEKAISRQSQIAIGVAEQEGWATSLAKAWGDTVIESFSEKTGDALTKAGGKLLSKLPFGRRFIDSLQRNWTVLTGGTADDFATKIFTKAGYSSILGEMGEERVGTLLREATGVSDRKGKFGERIWNGMKEDLTLENLGAELVTLLAPASIRRGMTLGVSLTSDVTVPSEAEQLTQAINVGKITFDSPEDTQGFAERAAEIALREDKNVTISTDLADNSVTFEELDKEGEVVVREPAKPARVVPPTIKEKQALPPTQSVTPLEKELIGVEPIDKVRIALSKAEAVLPQVKAEQTAERKKRVGAAAAVLQSNVKEGTPTDEAIFRSTGMLKGQLTDYEQRFESIEDQLTSDEKNALYEKIRNHPGLQYFDVVNTATSLRKLLGGVALSDGDVKNIKRVFGDSFVDDSGNDILADRQQVSSLFDRAVTLWKAGLLTGLKTSGLNVVSTMANAVSETAATAAGIPIDKVTSLFTGERALALSAKGTKAGVLKGFKDGWTYLRTGVSERDVGKKLDFRKVNFGTSKIARGLQAYEETIFHLLGAEDQPFYYGAKAQSIASQAKAQGITQGLKGKELNSFVDKKIQNPTDDMLEAAVHDAEVAVFQNRTLLGDIAKGIQNIPGGEIIVPFGRTPSAVATQIVNYTPVGIAAEVTKQIRNGEFNQRKFSQAFGRSIVGTGVLFMGGELLKAGILSLDFPKGEKERKLWELEGRKPNSVKIGGKWRSVQILGPIGNGLIIGGHFTRAFKEQGSPTKAIAEAMGKSAKSFTEQTFTTGIKKAVDALVDPERSAGEWFSSMAGSVVPTIVADIARASTDKEVRQDSAIRRVQSRIPGLRGKLPSKIDVFGQDLPRYGGNVLEIMIDPSRPSKIRNDIVVDELRRLSDNDFNVTPTLLGGKDGFDVLTDEENTQMWQRQGDLVYKTLQSLVTSEGYKKVSNDLAKKKMLEEIISKTRAAARAEMAAIKLSQGFSVIELAESGLLSVRELEALKFFGK
jgi:hypothetical protein